MTALLGEQPSVGKLIHMHDPLSEGFFDPAFEEPGLPQHNPEIDDWSEPKVEVNPFPGVRQIITTMITLDSGAKHVKRDFIPDYQGFDTKVGMMTALGTRVNGFNTETALRIASGGSEVSVVGFNQAVAHPSTLSADAEAAALLLGYNFDNQQLLVPDYRPIVLKGKSRGAMGAFGVSAYAEKYGLEVPVSFHQDPCLAQETGLKETLRKLTPLDVADELIELGRCLSEKWEDESKIDHVKRLGSLAKTIGVTPNYLISQIHSGKALWAGEAGGFIDHIPDGQVIIANFFNKNRLNHHATFESQIRRHEYGRVIGERLRHLALLRHEVMVNGTNSVWAAQTMIDMGKSREQIADTLAQPLVARQYVKHQRRLSAVA